MEELCPDALMLNYTNPMSMLCLAAGRSSSVPVVGLCHSVQGTSHQLARHADVPYEELVWECAGVNHLAWFTRLEHLTSEGLKDLYPVLREKVRGREGETWEADPVRFDMMLHFGAFITESSGHLSEYLPYYRKTQEARNYYTRDGYRGGSRFYATGWPNWRETADREREEMVRGEKEIPKARSWEYASWIIEAMEKHTPYVIYGNVMNVAGGAEGASGRLITNLPADGCVEVACLVDRRGVQPCRYGALPRQMAAVCESQMRYFDLAAEACIRKSKEAAIHALMLDPLTASVCTTGQIREMGERMFAAQKEFLPGFA
jgi:alpha-galactosidase